MPVFLKAGAIVPMQAHIQQGNHLGGAKDMHVIVAPGASNAFRLYEDDGVTRAFEQGAYAETPLTLTWTETSAVFTIGKAEGETSLLPEGRTWTVAFRGWRKGCRFTVNGKAVDAAYSPDTCTYTVHLDADAGEITVTHADGLLHDNSDYRDRIMDCLTRAQMEQDAKSQCLKWVDDTMKLPVERVRPLNTRPDLYPNLGAHLYELIMQARK
jgi:hypothetical protein